MARILYIWQKDFPWDVRTEKICRSLADAGHTVWILARWDAALRDTERRPEREMWKGIQIVRVGYEKRSALSLPISGNPLWAQALKRVVEEFQPNILMPREIMLAEAASTAARKQKIPVLIDMAEHYPAAMRGWKKYNGNVLSRFVVQTARIPDWVERRAVACADGIITVCDENSERLQRQYAYPMTQTQVVHNTPSLVTYSNVRKGSNQGLGSPPVEFAYHGYMMPERSLEMIVRGFALAAKRYSDIHLTLAGSGESFEDVCRTSESSGIQERINLPGGYSSDDWVRLFSATDVGFVLYRNDDFSNYTLPNKLFDYLACGKPVIVSDVRPMRRVIEETGAGIVTDCSRPEPIAEAIEYIRNADYATMSANGIRAAEQRYNWSVDNASLQAFVNRYL